MSSNKKTSNKEIKNVTKKSKLPLILVGLVVLGIIGFGAWYFLNQKNNSSETTESVEIASGNPKTPTETYKKLFEAVKNKNKSAIRSMMSKDSMGLANMQAGKSKKDVDEVLSNAFTSTVFTDKLPPIRDERVKGKFGAIEVYDYSKSEWQDLPFVIEDGAWKLAVGNLFAGTYERPGKGRATIERENANATGQTKVVPYSNSNTNTNIKPTVIDPTKGGKVPIPMQQPDAPPNKK